MTRFAVREAELADAEGIARAHTESWQSSYRGILPDTVLDRIDVGQRVEPRKKILRDLTTFCLVAFDLTHGDIVGFCDAGPARRQVPQSGEIFALYMVQHAKRHGMGQTMFERVQSHFAAQGWRSMIIWVLENNHHARGFYEAMGGRRGVTFPSRVGGFAVTELS